MSNARNLADIIGSAGTPVVTSNASFSANVAVTGAATFSNTVATGNTTVTGFANISSTLQVTGTGTIGSGSNNYLTINGSVSAGQPAYIAAAGVDSNVGIDINTKANGDLRFNTNSAVRMLLSGANGNIGIANSTPANPLVVRSANAHIYLQQDNTDHGSIVSGSAADGFFRIYRKDDSGTNERFRVETGGQLYHNQSYLLGSSFNCYYAKSTTSMNPTTAGWLDTGLTFSNVFIPTNTRKVLLWVQTALRNNGVNANHTALRCRVVNNSTSQVTYVGDGSWGFGINMDIDGGKNHINNVYNVNLLDFGTSGNQAGLTAGSTYTIYMQVLDAFASGGSLRLAGESNGVYANYTPHHGFIWVI